MATHTYQLEIPITALNAITTDVQRLRKTKYLTWKDEWDEVTPETVGALIVDSLGGRVKDEPEVRLDGTQVVLSGRAEGYESDTLGLFQILIGHGVIGIVKSTTETKFLLTELAPHKLTFHNGHVEFPSYEGTVPV